MHPKCVKVRWTSLASSSLMIWRNVEGYTDKNPTLQCLHVASDVSTSAVNEMETYIMYCTISKLLQNMQSVANWTD
jgi:hypothetical protein